MSDLRESGSIEQDADVVMMLHREAYYHKQDPNWVEANPTRANVAEVIVAKQRNGPTGTVDLLWDSSATAFRNLVQHGAVRGVEYAARAEQGAEYGDIPA
jgi:replicative DNA helicase